MKILFTQSVLAKVLLLALLTLLAALPLAQVHGLIEDRGASRARAAQELALAHAGQQVLAGPLLVVPFVERWTEVQLDDKQQVKARVQHARQAAHVIFPEKSDLRGRLAPQERYRGIFTVLFYELQGRMRGSFPAFDPARVERTVRDSTIEFQPPVLALAVSDLRGLQGAPKGTLGGAELGWLPRVPAVAEDSWLARGIHAPLPAAALQAWDRKQPLDFEFDLRLVGQERLAVVPVAGETTAHLASSWAHPSFGGNFLAARREVSERGFDADWAVSSLVSTARAQLLRTIEPATAGNPRIPLESFDVSLVEPLNVYALTGRAVKYGLLFVGLVLMATFMFELFRKLPLHPVQYGLVALAIVVFFLLLLALSEKVAFGIAYAAAAGASTALLTVYFSAVLRGWRRGAGLGAYVAVLYAALFGLLSSEDNALLLGALLLFGLLGLLMIGTRRVDWYAFSSQPAPTAAASA